MTENPRTKTDGVVPGQHGFARKCHATERARSGSARSFGRPSLSAMGSPDQGEGRTCSSRDRRSHCRRARQRTRPSCEFGDGCRRRASSQAVVGGQYQRRDLSRILLRCPPDRGADDWRSRKSRCLVIRSSMHGRHGPSPIWGIMSVPPGPT